MKSARLTVCVFGIFVIYALFAVKPLPAFRGEVGPSRFGLSAVVKTGIKYAMKHNSYFEGKVQSLAIGTTDGPATVGVIEPGKYSFGTDCEEHMHVVLGTLKAKLPGDDWKSYSKGQHFIVPPNVKFEVETSGDVAYVCYYKR